MFIVECVLFYLIVGYAMLCYLVNYYSFSKLIKTKVNDKISGLQVAQSLLKINNINIYVVKSTNSNSIYDPKRNAIRLNDNDYNGNNYSSIIKSLFIAITATNINNYKNRAIFIIAKYSYIFFSLLYMIGIISNDLSLMTIALVFIVIIIIFKYQQSSLEIDIYNESIEKIKKEYKLSNKEIEIVSKYTRKLINSEMAIKLI